MRKVHLLGCDGRVDDKVESVKIGIIAPSPVPFQVGGAEGLWTGLRRYINEHTNASAEVVKLPVSEATFWSTVEGYESFHNLDVSGFDRVITGKYPAWMVQHPQHTLYMLHPCRGLYEFYQGPTVLTEHEARLPTIKKMWDALEKHQGDAAFVSELFAALREWRQRPEQHDAIAWPGPFARRVIRFLDGVALSNHRIRRYASISNTVVKRADYFPTDVSIAIAHPPASTRVCTATADANAGAAHRQAETDSARRSAKFIFSVSRLDTNKRMALIAESFLRVSGEIELHIAGVGAELEALQTYARRDPRIKVLGRISNDDLSWHYAHCEMVVFTPYDEDYGLVAAEALAAGKPLITCSDSGGGAEINLHQQTGLTVEPTADALSAAMQYLLASPDALAAFGKKARVRSAEANWPAVYQALTGAIAPVFGTRNARRLVVTLSWAFFPPLSGGQVRVYHLYKNLAKCFDVAIVCLVKSTEQYSDVEVASGLREIRVPKTKHHDQRDESAEIELGVPVYDITGGLYIEDTPQFREVLVRECTLADAVVACHPYFAPLLREVFDGPLCYEAQDVEQDIKTQLLPSKSRLTKAFLEFTGAAEKLACDEAEHIWVCSDADGVRLGTLYPSAAGKLRTVTNGTDVNSFRFKNVNERIDLRGKLLRDTTHTFALFLGSGHGPNIDAVKEIFHAAVQTPQVIYWVVGSVCYAFDPLQKPHNVWFLGEMSETERRVVMELASVALNPLKSGSGTSIKMFDYMACGLPIVSSAVGARGLGLVDKATYFACDTDEIGTFLTHFDSDSVTAEAVAKNARIHVETHGDWATQVRQLAYEILTRFENVHTKLDDFR